MFKKLAFVILFILLLVILLFADKKLNFLSAKFLTSAGKPIIRVKLINAPMQTFDSNSIGSYALFKEVLEEKYFFKQVFDDNYDVVIDGNDGNEPIKNQNAFKIYFQGEALPANRPGYDLILGFEYLEADNYLRLPVSFEYLPQSFLKNHFKLDYNRNGECRPKDKSYFACFLVTNSKSKERIEMFHRLSLYKHVASGGKLLNNLDGHIIRANETIGWLGQCKFVIAFENTNDFPGYITEKVFRAYFAGAVPIYSSHPSVLNDINKNAIIAAPDFKTLDDLVNYVIEVDQDDQKYCQIWQQKLLTDPYWTYDEVRARLKEKMKKLFY